MRARIPFYLGKQYMLQYIIKLNKPQPKREDINPQISNTDLVFERFLESPGPIENWPISHETNPSV